MLKVEKIGKEQTNSNSDHVFYSTEEASKLALFFPGGNSNATGPYFYYLRDYFLRNGYDVLVLSYIGLVEQGDSYDVQVNKITIGLHTASEYVQNKKNYNSIVFVSRSFGNVLSTIMRKNYTIDVDKCIYISPTAQALRDIEKHPGFIITSDQDEYLEEKHLEEIRSFPKHDVLVFEGLDHGLECEDTIKNMDYCRESIAKAIVYITKNNN